MSTRIWTRRATLILGLTVAGGVALARPAGAAEVTVGDLAFTVPSTITPGPPDAAGTYGPHWQWLGQTPGPKADPATLVLARADLPGTDPEELTGLVLAGSAAGLLPSLQLTGRRTRSMPGGGAQTRLDLSYLVRSDLTYHGTLLVATREKPPSALLVVLGDDQLTAGTVDAVLDSARWLR